MPLALAMVRGKSLVVVDSAILACGSWKLVSSAALLISNLPSFPARSISLPASQLYQCHAAVEGFALFHL